MALAPRSKPPLALGWRIMLHFGAAVAAGLVFAACVLAGNLAGLRDLLAQSPQPFTGLVFALGAITAFAPATFLTFVSTITHAQDAQP